MKTRFLNKGLYIFITALSFFGLSGCDSSNSEDEAPEVIPSEVFSLPVDLFNPVASKSSQAGVNFTAAALRVWPVSLIITANLVIPSLTTLQALQAEPTYQDGEWLWSSSTSANGQTVEFNLTANRTGVGTEWSMKISMTDPLTQMPLNDFELFTAVTTQNGEVGSWQLFYYQNESSVNVLNASYTISSETEKSITFSVPETAALGAGDSIEYAELGDERSFIWIQTGASISHTVRWNAVTKEGSIIASNFNGGVMGCWDASFEDVPC